MKVGMVLTQLKLNAKQYMPIETAARVELLVSRSACLQSVGKPQWNYNHMRIVCSQSSTVVILVYHVHSQHNCAQSKLAPVHVSYIVFLLLGLDFILCAFCVSS